MGFAGGVASLIGGIGGVGANGGAANVIGGAAGTTGTGGGAALTGGAGGATSGAGGAQLFPADLRQTVTAELRSSSALTVSEQIDSEEPSLPQPETQRAPRKAALSYSLLGKVEQLVAAEILLSRAEPVGQRADLLAPSRSKVDCLRWAGRGGHHQWR